MEPIAYQQLAESETHGWYYQARLDVVLALIKRLVLPRSAPPLKIVDIGCGTGGSTKALQMFGDVVGVEPSPIAAGYLRRNFPNLKVIDCTVAELPEHVDANAFDLAVILGVLYHKNVPDPAAALANVCGVLKPGGFLIWNEAAYEILRRHHDDVVHGERRFSPRVARALLAEAGLQPVFFSHLLGWGFPVALILALLFRLKGESTGNPGGGEAIDHKAQSSLLTWFLHKLTFWEWRIGSWGLKMPFGVSWILVARKPAPRTLP